MPGPSPGQDDRTVGLMPRPHNYVSVSRKALRFKGKNRDFALPGA